MRLCIPTDTDDGLEARLSDHFGRAPWFTFLDPETGETESVPNTTCDNLRRGRGHRHGEGEREGHGRGHGNGRALLTILIGRDCGAVVCRNLGRGASVRLREAGIDVRTSRAGRVREVMAG